MGRILAFLKTKAATVILYLALLVVSHVALPALGKETVGPFFTWQLFSDISLSPSYDLNLKWQDKKLLLSDYSEVYGIEQGGKYFLWSLTQSMERYRDKLTPEAMAHVARIEKNLSDYGLVLEGICRVRVKLPEYMLMPTEQKRENCEALLR